MPNYRQPDPGAATNAFARQVQLGAGMRAADQSEQMNTFALAQAQREDEAARQPKYDPGAFQKVGAITSQISAIADPAQKRQAFRAAYDQNQKLFDSFGVPREQVLPKLDSLDDAQFDEMLQGFSKFAPQAAAQDVAPGHSLVRPDGKGGFAPAYTAPTAPGEGGDGFSLSPGQVRFDKNGRRIAGVAAAPDDGSSTFKNAAELRKEFNAQSGTFRGVADSYQRIQDSARDPSPAGDLSLIFNYMKVLDPGSTVREGEFATAQNAGAIDDRVVGLYNRIRSGERLSGDQRADFVNRATRLYQGQESRYNSNVRDRYVGLAKRYGLNPEEVIGGVSAKVPTSALPKNNAQGWTLHEDAKGNRAYVGPNGEIEEVQ